MVFTNWDLSVSALQFSLLVSIRVEVKSENKAEMESAGALPQ